MNIFNIMKKLLGNHGPRLHFAEVSVNDNRDDWADYLEDIVFEKLLPRAGSGSPVGTVRITGMLELKRTLVVPPRVRLQGAFPPGWHGGCGFTVSDGFSGGTLLRWNQPVSRDRILWYSSFGAGMDNLFLQCCPPDKQNPVGGAIFCGSQQCSSIDTVIIRGFRSNIGLRIAGDTYSINRVFTDPLNTGTGNNYVAIGISSYGSRLIGVTGTHLTSHNCGVGLRLGDMEGCHFNMVESETTTTPVQLTYNARSCSITGVRSLHSDAVCHVTKAKFPRHYSCRLEGHVLSGRAAALRTPAGNTNMATVYDVNVQDYL